MAGFGTKAQSTTLTTAATAYPLGTGLAASDCYVIADSSNSGSVTIGGSDVATVGFPVSKTVPLKLSEIMSAGHYESYNLADVYAAGTSNGDKIILLYAKVCKLAV